ncbi:hypothetical protein [Algibacter aquimarinus]
MSFLLAVVSLKIYHKKIVKNTLAKHIGKSVNPITDRNIFTPNDHKMNGL